MSAITDRNGGLKIGFLNSLYVQNNTENTSWSITNRYMAQALQKYCGEVTYIAPIHLPELKLAFRLERAKQKIFKKNVIPPHTLLAGKRYGHKLTKRLLKHDFDLIFAPTCWAETAFVKTHTPIVLVEDASFCSIYNYYPKFSNLCKRSYSGANVLAERSLTQASLILYPSQWAAQAAIESYHLSPEKVRVIPFGANIDRPPSTEVVLKRKRSDRCKLLFIGGDWVRKGGAITLETLLELEKLGIQAELTVCGSVPPAIFSHERMRVIPYLSREDPVQHRELEELYETSDFFFMPTRSECYGHVFCEASSFGLPVIATDTGGVPGAITNGENGFLLPPSARGPEYAELIARIYRDEQRYAELVKSSRAAFDRRLHWDAWGRAASERIREMLERERSYFPLHSATLSTGVKR